MCTYIYIYIYICITYIFVNDGLSQGSIEPLPASPPSCCWGTRPIPLRLRGVRARSAPPFFLQGASVGPNMPSKSFRNLCFL